MKAKGARNHYIAEAIAAGLHYRDGKLWWADGKELCPTKDSKGYWRVCLGPASGRSIFNRARIVCWLVHGPPPNPSDGVDHINRDQGDDDPSNLRWATASENARNVSPDIRAKQVLTDADAREIHALRRQGVTQRAIAERFSLSTTTVSRIIRGIAWPHTA